MTYRLHNEENTDKGMGKLERMTTVSVFNDLK